MAGTLLLSLIACAGSSQQRLDMAALEPDEGYVVFRLLSPEMATDPQAIWDKDIRVHHRPVDAGPLNAVTSSMKLRGRYVALSAGDGPKLVVLKLPGGDHVFYSVVTSLQEAPIEAHFQVANGQATYIGDIRIDVRLSIGEIGVTRIEGASATVGWAPQTIPGELKRLYLEGVPKLRFKQAGR